MRRPPFEVADIIRTAGSKFRQRYWRARTWPQVKVLHAIVRCRTAALGGHRDQCDQCGYPSHSIVVVTAIAQSVKPMPERSGCDVGNKSCYPSFTTISSLAFRTPWFHSY